MDEILKAVVLGLIKGLTEYLPVSSAAHLRIIPAFFGWKDVGAGFTAVVQTGTMTAIIIYFAKDLFRMFKAFFGSIKKKDYMQNPESKQLILIAIGTVPLLIFGYLLKDLVRHQFRDMYVIAGSMIAFAFVLYAAEKYTNKTVKTEKLTVKDAVIIGLFQCFALLPGASRSGSTISGAFFRNMDRSDAARFSFLLLIPAVLSSGVYELISERGHLLASHESTISLIVATLVDGIVGYLTIWFLLSFIRKHSLMFFVIYRIVMGTLIIILLVTHVINN